MLLTMLKKIDYTNLFQRRRLDRATAETGGGR